MDVGLARVGLALLLEPQSTANACRAGSIVAGSLLPAYHTYKAVVAPRRGPPGAAAAAAASAERERWCRFWAVAGLLYAGERLLGEQLLERCPWYPHTKFAVLVWLQLHGGAGAACLFESYLVPWLGRYERKLDVLLEAGAQLVELLGSTYAGPLSALRSSVATATAHAAAFIKWLATPDELPPGQGQQGQQGKAKGGCGGSPAARRR